MLATKTVQAVEQTSVKSLTERGMLASVTIRCWTGSKKDKKITKEVAEQYAVDEKVGRYTRELIDRGALRPYEKLAGEIRDFHRTNTLPWGDDGRRLLPAVNYLAYQEKMTAYKHQLAHVSAEFCVQYTAHVEKAKERLQAMFNPADYPSESKIRSKFGLDFDIDPIPEGSDFRVDMADDERQKIKAQIEARVQSALDGAVRDIWQRVHDCVEHIADRMKAYKPADAKGEKTEGVFKDTLISNMRDLVELLPRLNITGDVALDAMSKQLREQLCGYEPEDLRKSQTLRDKVARDADKILEALAGYVG